MAVVLGKAEIVDIFLLGDRLVAKKQNRRFLFHIGARKFQRRNFQIETVDDEQVRRRQNLDVGRHRLESMRIDPFGNDARQSNLSPATFSTMLVIGATVVTTLSFFSAWTGAGFSSCRPQAVKKSVRVKMTNQVMTFVGFICEKRGLFSLGELNLSGVI